MEAGTRVERRGGRGRCLIAARDFSAGDEVLRCEPLRAVVLELPLACSWCFEEVRLKRCKRCNRVTYCSRSCQSADWESGHNAECRAFRKIRADARPSQSVRLAARVMRCARSDAVVSSQLDELVHHVDSLSAEERENYSEAVFLARALLAAGDAGSGAVPVDVPLNDQTLQLLGRIACNGFTVTDGESRPLGLGLYPAAAAANHSCRPTCCTVFSGRSLSLRCVRAVTAGAELTIAYTDLAKPRRVRRSELFTGYRFRCDCQRCERPPPEDVGLDALLCPLRNCRGAAVAVPAPQLRAAAAVSAGVPEQYLQWVTMDALSHVSEPAPSSSSSSPAERFSGSLDADPAAPGDDIAYDCTRCTHRLTAEELKAAAAAVRRTDSLLSAGRASFGAGDAAAARQRFSDALNLSDAFLHPCNYRRVEGASELLDCVVCLSEYPAAAELACEVVLPACRAALAGVGAPWPPVGTRGAMAAKLLYTQGDEAAPAVAAVAAVARAVLEEAWAVLRVTHGEGHSLLRDLRKMMPPQPLPLARRYV